MANEEYLKDAPQLSDPVTALHKITRDLSLNAKVRIDDGTEMTAIEIQRWYLKKAKSYLKETIGHRESRGG